MTDRPMACTSGLNDKKNNTNKGFTSIRNTKDRTQTGISACCPLIVPL